MVNKVKVSVLVAAHNEEEIILSFLESFLAMMKKIGEPWEMIIVENGSTDRTAEIIRNFSKKHTQIKLEQLPNPAYGKAMITAFKKAKGDYAVFFNVDFWDERFIRLCKIDLLGYDLVGSSKLLKNSNDTRPFTRRLITQFYSLFLRLFLGFKGTDTHGIKAFRIKSVLPIVKKCKTTTGIFDSELVLRCQRAGLSFLELPVEVREIRPTRFNFKRVLQTPADIFKLFLALKT